MFSFGGSLFAVFAFYPSAMACILFPSPIFGPVKSRRLGVSLGINLLPADRKLCSFDCVYCECGFNKDHGAKPVFPARKEVREKLERKLRQMTEEGSAPDVITFAGNGEPTSHPEFAEVIEDTIGLRNRYFPKALISVLSNSTFVERPGVFEALKKVDNPIMKLDTVDESFIRAIDKPNAKFDLPKIIEKLKAFKGDVIIQTMFLTGTSEGKEIDNTTDQYVDPWIETLKAIAPREVMIYTIDRETPEKGLRKASKEQLDRIKAKVEKAGLKVQVSY